MPDHPAYPRPADLKALKEDKSLKMPDQAGFNLGYIAYNVMHKVKGSNEPNPLADLRVRQALDMSVNKPQIIDSVYQGAGQLAVNAMPPTQWSYDTTIKDAKFDPEKAKELLKQAGVKEGTEIILWAMPVQRPYNPNAKLMAEMLQSTGRRSAQRQDLRATSGASTSSAPKAARTGAMLIGWSGDNGDPDNWLRLCSAATPSTATTSPNGVTRRSTTLSSKPRNHRPGQAHRTVQAGATRAQRCSPNDTYRPLDCLSTHAQRTFRTSRSAHSV